jgi:hypothetical protein
MPLIDRNLKWNFFSKSIKPFSFAIVYVSYNKNINWFNDYQYENSESFKFMYGYVSWFYVSVRSGR